MTERRTCAACSFAAPSSSSSCCCVCDCAAKHAKSYSLSEKIEWTGKSISLGSYAADMLRNVVNDWLSTVVQIWFF